MSFRTVTAAISPLEQFGRISSTRPEAFFLQCSHLFVIVFIQSDCTFFHVSVNLFCFISAKRLA
jgi:hypothetical protein